MNIKEELRNDLYIKLQEFYGRETLRGVGRAMQVGGEALSGKKVKWRHLGTGVGMAAKHLTKGLGRMVNRNPVKSLIGAAGIGAAAMYGINSMNSAQPTSPNRVVSGHYDGSSGLEQDNGFKFGIHLREKRNLIKSYLEKRLNEKLV